MFLNFLNYRVSKILKNTTLNFKLQYSKTVNFESMAALSGAALGAIAAYSLLSMINSYSSDLEDITLVFKYTLLSYTSWYLLKRTLALSGFLNIYTNMLIYFKSVAFRS